MDLVVQVVATTDEGTRSALDRASRLTGHLDARIDLVVPHVVSYVADPDDSAGASEAITDHYRELASAAGVQATVRLCFCRRREDVFRWILRKRSLIIIGGRHRKWWPTAAERLAHHLVKAGHEVIFAAF